MFSLSQPSTAQKQRLLAAASEVAAFGQPLLTLADGARRPFPKGFVHDLSRSELGRGFNAFAAARAAFQRWEQFNLRWVQLVGPDALLRPNVAPGQLVAVQAHTACFWSVNINRVVETVDSAHRFGFLYATTPFHVEQGQERFVLDFDPETGSVAYLIEAVSRPRHPLARIAYPFSRAMQHRFARDSHARMQRWVAADRFTERGQMRDEQ